MSDHVIPGQVGGEGVGEVGGGVNPTDVVVDQPKGGKDSPKYSSVGLEELAKTDRVLVQQLAEYSESTCTCGYEGENQFEVTDRFGHQIFLAEEDSACCFRQCCESLRGFEMTLTDRQGKPSVKISRPLRCDNCCVCPCFTQEMTVECPAGNLAGRVEQSISLFTPTYVIKDRHGEEKFVIEGPTSFCSCFKSCCKCCRGRDVVFRIVEISSERQVGSISKKWNGVLKDVLTTADRFSIDFPPDIDVEFKVTLLAATFLIDYLHFEADPNDSDDEDE
eukprot:GFUD01104737.1.p1 GENE.GFUD01104737.1~~GFUD01104737.1.p1  ORF type:complete len:277 (-),score=75.24 GFUD01104737.1:96-926(-)